jgi:hypothetical protein
MSAPDETATAGDATDGRAGPGQSSDDPDDRSREELRALVDSLEAENERLRGEYARVRRADHRRSAAALLLLGALGVLGGLTLTRAQEVLFVLGAVGLFGGALAWFLVPERFVTATVGESVYDAVSATGARLRDELGLSETSVYVPSRRGPDPPAWLFVPQSESTPVPEDPEALFVLAESPGGNGISVRPTAATMVAAFDAAVSRDTTADAESLTGQLVEGLVEQFELVRSADPSVDAEGGRVTVGVEGSAYGDVTGFDHPVASFLGTGLARGLDRPVTVETERADDRLLVTCRWDADDADEDEDTTA